MHFAIVVLKQSTTTPSTADINRTARHIRAGIADFFQHALKILARAALIDADPAALVDAIDASGFTELPVTAAHAAGVASLPQHHGDPFDRLLVAQALAMPLRLLTVDEQLAQYSDLVLLL